MTYSNSITFGSTSVNIEVDEFNNVNFWVDNSFEVKENNPHRVAITKWLIKEWKQIKDNYKYLFCIAYDDDYIFKDRVNSYIKLGFTHLNNNGFIYLNFSSLEEQEETIAELLKVCPEEFSPISGEEGELWVQADVPELGFYKPVGLPIKRVSCRRR